MDDRLALLDDPQLRPFLPLLYVAWADETLTADERTGIAARIAASPWLRPRARHAVESFLDAGSPPSASELAHVRKTLERAAGTMSAKERGSLEALATSLAGDARDKSAEAARAIAQSLALVTDAEDPDLHDVIAQDGASLDVAYLDVAAMQRAREGEHAALRAEIRAFLDDPEKRAYGLPTDEYRALVRGWLEALVGRFGHLAFPGKTADVPDLRGFMVAFEALAHGDLSLVVKVGVQLGLFGGSIYFLGTERHHALLPDVATLRLPGCFAMSEVGHGSNVAAIETVARYDHATRELEIHTPSESARKEWIGGAAHDARMATVFVQLEVGGERHGVHAVLVPLRDASGATLPGVRTGDSGLKMGLNGVDNGRIFFDHVRVPVANLLDRFGTIDDEGRYASPIASPSKRFFTMLGTLVGGRICVGAAGVSVAESALAIAIRYATSRRQFGPDAAPELPLLRYPTHKQRLVPALATTYVLRFAFERLRARFAEVHATRDADTRALEAEAAGLKALATWHAIATVQQCREACGGQGYLAVNRLPDLRVDCDVFATFEGDNTVLMGLVARSLLTRFGKRLEDGRLRGVLRMAAEIAATRVREKNSVVTSDTSREHLRDRRFHLAALEYREETLVRTAAQRMQRRVKRGMPAHEAALALQDHFVAAATAYTERLAFAWFDDAVKALPDGDTRRWLGTIGDLHALALIERHLAFYLEEGYVDPSKARAIRKEVRALTDEVATVARDLVLAFGIPDACLAAPIAFFDPAHPLADAQRAR